MGEDTGVDTGAKDSWWKDSISAIGGWFGSYTSANQQNNQANADREALKSMITTVGIFVVIALVVKSIFSPKR